MYKKSQIFHKSIKVLYQQFSNSNINFSKKQTMNQELLQNNSFPIYLPKPTVQLGKIFAQLKLFSKQRLDTNDQNQEGVQTDGEIKGLKFISTKLAKLFFKNRKLPYNQISKILIDNFASQKKDERNIKRRVYDAINVLVAAGILVKKNNSIEMIKNKIKPKFQTDKKQKIEEQISQKQAVIKQKVKKYEQLIHKHKLINKLFTRNYNYTINKQTHEGQHLKESIKRSLSRKKSRNQIEMQFEGKKMMKSDENQVLFSEGKDIERIDEPYILIMTNRQNLRDKDQEKYVIKRFQDHNQIEILIPDQLQQVNRQQQINNQLAQNNYFMWTNQINPFNTLENSHPTNSKPNQQQSTISASKDIYSFIDILQFLQIED